MANQEGRNLVSEVIGFVIEISWLPECRNALRNRYGNLRRRVMLLWPLFQQLVDKQQKFDDGCLKGLNDLTIALNSVVELLNSVKDGSKIIQVMRIEKLKRSFQVVTTQIEEALSQIHYDKLDLSEDDYEQLKLVHMQFKREKDQMDSPNFQLLGDLALLQRDLALLTTEFTSNSDKVDSKTVIGLSEKLCLTTDEDLDTELGYNFKTQNGDDKKLLKISKYIVHIIRDFKTTMPKEGTGVMTHQSTGIVPNDFKCPISWEVMGDPVILSTGHTFERSLIRNWIKDGKETCPKTRQPLFNMALTPNYAIKKSIIAYSCTRNGGSECDRTVISSLVQKFELPEYRFNLREHMYGNFMRIIPLMSPLFEEFEENQSKLNDGNLIGQHDMVVTLKSVMELLKSVYDDSKIFQVLKIKKTTDMFHEVATKIEETLSQVYNNKFGLSVDVYEQFKLVHKQFIGKRMDSPYMQLQGDLAMVSEGKKPDLEMVKQLCEKLQLVTIDDIKRESIAIEMGVATCGYPNDSIDILLSLLKTINDYVMLGYPKFDMFKWKEISLTHESRVIPDEYRCSKSLQLMKDPVVVSTGQTYERSAIQKWLDAGHNTCPKTQHMLSHTVLTTNYALKNVIALWCNRNEDELPGRNINPRQSSSIDSLIQKLASKHSDEQRLAACELRLLARNVDARECLAKAIPPLVKLLRSPDGRTQVQAVAALMNLSVHVATNKALIIRNGALPSIVYVLENGSTEAREYAASIICGLLFVDGNKFVIEQAGAIPPLIKILEEGTPRGKFAAAAAIHKLCVCKRLLKIILEAGIVTSLKILLKDAGGWTKDKALSILSKLASDQEGKTAISKAEIMPVVVEALQARTSWSCEIALLVLWNFYGGNDVFSLKIIKKLGAEVALKELSEKGTDKVKEKASLLHERLNEMQQEL